MRRKRITTTGRLIETLILILGHNITEEMCPTNEEEVKCHLISNLTPKAITCLREVPQFSKAILHIKVILLEMFLNLALI
jgi:hypothetical protein